jgi:hypothetical protein
MLTRISTEQIKLRTKAAGSYDAHYLSEQHDKSGVKGVRIPNSDAKTLP